MGGTGADTITTGSGTSFVFGDDGLIDWAATLYPQGPAWAGANSEREQHRPRRVDEPVGRRRRPHHGRLRRRDRRRRRGERHDHRRLGDEHHPRRQRRDLRRGRGPRRPVRLAADHTRPRRDDAPGIGGNDTIQTGTGNSIVMGGTGDDMISTVLGGAGSNNTDFVFGDDGYITWAAAEDGLNPSSAAMARRATATRATSTSSRRPTRGTAATTDHDRLRPARSSSAVPAATRSPAAPART